MNRPKHPTGQTLALFESGDLRSGAARRVASHVNTCTHCREMLHDLKADLELLQSGLPEPSGADVVELRTRVIESLTATPPPKWPSFSWLAAGGAAAVALLLAMIASNSRPALKPHIDSSASAVQLPALNIEAYTIPEPVIAHPATARPVRHSVRRKAGLRDAAVLTAADGSEHLQIRTTDPNVIILLPMNEMTDEEKN